MGNSSLAIDLTDDCVELDSEESGVERAVLTQPGKESRGGMVRGRQFTSTERKCCNLRHSLAFSCRISRTNFTVARAI